MKNIQKWYDHSITSRDITVIQKENIIISYKCTKKHCNLQMDDHHMFVHHIQKVQHQLVFHPSILCIYKLLYYCIHQSLQYLISLLCPSSYAVTGPEKSPFLLLMFFNKFQESLWRFMAVEAVPFWRLLLVTDAYVWWWCQFYWGWGLQWWRCWQSWLAWRLAWSSLKCRLLWQWGIYGCLQFNDSTPFAEKFVTLSERDQNYLQTLQIFWQKIEGGAIKNWRWCTRLNA